MCLPVVSWYCSQRCAEVGGEEQDHVRNYSLALTWNGLLDLSHRDIIREADGLALISMWRLNVPRFWSGNHYKYLIIAHRLLAGTVYCLYISFLKDNMLGCQKLLSYKLMLCN